MYKVTSTTQYNVIHLEVEDLDDERLQTVLTQPYVLDMKIEKVETKTLIKVNK